VESSSTSMCLGQSSQLWCQQTITSQPVSGWPWSRKLRLSNSNSRFTRCNAWARSGVSPRNRGNRLALIRLRSPNVSRPSKKEHDALFVDRFVAQGREVHGSRRWGVPLKAGVGMSWEDSTKGACVRGAGTRSLAQGRRVSVPLQRARRIRNEGQDIGPLALAGGEIAKSLRQGRPAAESFFQRDWVVLSVQIVGATRRHGA